MEQECKKCYRVFPWTTEFFNWEVKKKKILKRVCKDCFHVQAKMYRDKYKKQKQEIEDRKDHDMYTLIELSHEEKQELLYNACVVIYQNAFEETLSKAEFEKLKITV